jgi:hypothetical protein
MSDAIKVIGKVIAEATKDGEPWEEGDEMGFVLNDGIVIVSMEEGRHLKVKVLAGTPKKLDLSLGLVEEDEE